MAQIIWSEKSIKSMENIAEYISADSEFYAKKTIREMKNLIDNLKLFPNMGKMVPEYNDISIKQILYKTYRIIYKIENNNIIVLTIISGFQKLL